MIDQVIDQNCLYKNQGACQEQVKYRRDRVLIGYRYQQARKKLSKREPHIGGQVVSKADPHSKQKYRQPNCINGIKGSE